MKLQPNAKTILWGKAKCGPNGREYDAMFETNLISLRHEVVVASALVTVLNGWVPLRVLNLHNRVIKIYRNQPLATLLWMTFQDVVHPVPPGKQYSMQTQADPDSSSVPSLVGRDPNRGNNTPRRLKKKVSWR